MGYINGRMCRIYTKVASVYTQVLIAKSPVLGLEFDENEVTDAASIFKRTLKGLASMPLSFELNRVVGDAAYKALRDASLDPDAVVTIAIASGDIEDVGEEYFEADWMITKFPLNGGIDATSTVQVEARMAANATTTPGMFDVTV